VVKIIYHSFETHSCFCLLHYRIWRVWKWKTVIG